MAQTANNIIDAVGSELNRTDLQSGGSNNTVTQRALNDTIRDILNRHAFSWRVTNPPVAISTVVNQTVYDISASKSIQDIYAVWLDTGDTQSRFLPEINLLEYIRKYPNVDYLPSQKPVTYARVDVFKIKCAPRPDSASYKFQIFYTLQFAGITDFTLNITDVPDRVLELVKIGTMYRTLRWTREYDKVPFYTQLFEQQVKVLTTEDKENPNLVFKLQGARFSVSPIRDAYWKSPFVDRV